MSKAEETKAYIIQKAADLFNQQGFAGSSLSDIMQATGLKKGGIYNHFSSKDELALAAFDFAVQQVSQRYINALRQETGAIGQLHAIVETFYTAIYEAPIKGGCPLMNTAIDSDDAHPALRHRVQQAMGEWRNLIRQLVSRGIDRGEISPTTDSEIVATIMIATLEGSLMLSKLYDDSLYMRHAADHLHQYLDQCQGSSHPSGPG